MSKTDIGITSNELKEQIQYCKLWINTWVNRRKTINSLFSSYRLKHAVENTARPNHINNESFIVAAQQLGFKAKYSSAGNAYFNMSFVKALHSSGNSGLRRV